VRKRAMKRLLATLVTVLAGFTFAAAAPTPAWAGPGDNSAVAVNTKDGASVFKLAFAIREVAGDVVDSQNAAVAYASCNDCQTVAIAIDIVFVMNDPSVVKPTNVAVAVNDLCTNCQTLALAYQFVIGVSGPVHFTATGRQEIAQIRQRLEDLKQSNLPIAEIRDRVEVLIARLKNVLRTQLVQSGKAGRAHVRHRKAAAAKTPTTPEVNETTEETETTEVPEDTTETATTDTTTTATTTEGTTTDTTTSP
jgi:putative peptide zinc metalloprotease protein